MRSLTKLVEQSSARQLNQSEIDWLHLLMADWQVLADLAAADLVLWLPTVHDDFVAVALCRSATATTVHLEDIVGLRSSQAKTSFLSKALESKQIIKQDGANWAGSYSLSNSYVPVVYRGKAIAVVSREANLSSPASALSSELWTVGAADILCEMMTCGEYPYETTPSVTAMGVPRVNDGAILIDTAGVVEKITPNANSCMRRIGVRSDLLGQSLVEEITEVARNHSMIDETLAVVVMGRSSWRAQLEAQSSTIALRALPLLKHGSRVGAVLLTRDITEMALREQELMTKDATIREIHHRVKNNLQTVSALLRMQARRTSSEEAKQALREAGRRVEAIAAVHDALSQNVDETVAFDDVVASILRTAASVAVTTHPVDVTVEGEFGVIQADAAIALATVLTELVTNSVEHAFPDRAGNINITAKRDGKTLTVVLTDDGVGIKRGAELTGLGTQIVQMMVRGELQGTIDWSPGEGDFDTANPAEPGDSRPGTVVTLELRVDEH